MTELKPTPCTRLDCRRIGVAGLCLDHLTEKRTTERAAQGLPPVIEDPAAVQAAWSQLMAIHARTPRPALAATSPLAPADGVATSAGRDGCAPPLAS